MLPAWFGGREGSIVVEVANEEVKGWVEAGKASVPLASRRLVEIKVDELVWETWVE